jgi:flagellar biosynthesis protein FlhA
VAGMMAEGLISKGVKHGDIIAVVAIVLILAMMVIPLPSFLLDTFLALNISMSLLVLLVTMTVRQPLEFSSFPSLLLLLTLFRLALNISSTRLVLLHGFAGQLIHAFGSFVIGGNYVVGFVVFLILVVINFIVITKGAERVAEVAARFTLDAMPGKQMSVDADLNSGLLTQEQSRERRQEIQQEANFYGAMDGASKFVKGDAIAGLVITAINIVGGLVVGVVQQNLPFAAALQKYTLLTVGDGLVSQIPALLISTATGIIITRSAGEENLGEGIVGQLLIQPRMLQVGGGIIASCGLIPGLPTLAFMTIGGITALLGTLQAREAVVREQEGLDRDAALRQEESKKPESVLSLLQTDRLELEIGYGLISMVDAAQGGDLLDRITMVRRQIALDLGVVVPAVRIRDNMQLAPQAYVIKVLGMQVGKGELAPERCLAMGPDLESVQGLDGIATQDPAFGLPALWIPSRQRFTAESAGLTVVEPAAVLATHLTQVIRNHAPELLGRQETKMLLDALKPDNAALVDEIVPDTLTLGEVQKVLQNLLREGVSIRHLVVILEHLADLGRSVKDADALSEAVRESLGRQIVTRYAASDGTLMAIALEHGVEEELLDVLARSGQSAVLPWDPARAQMFIAAMQEQTRSVLARGDEPVLLTPPALRLPLRRLLQRSLPSVPVLSYNEIPLDTQVQVVSLVGLEHAS